MNRNNKTKSPMYHLCCKANRKGARRHIALSSFSLPYLRKVGLGLNIKYDVTIDNGSWETVDVRAVVPIDSEHDDIYWI